jgi:eukaryotic-like serine/threonine-protein kinase
MDIDEQTKARVGQVFNKKYTLGRLIGSGGMATVYEATHRNGHRVAIKILHGHVSASEDLRARFLREGYVANKVEHPGAVRVLDDDTAEDGSVFLVMDLLEGETLDARTKRFGGRLPALEVCTFAFQVLDVLAAAHDKGVVHRDVKPENLFLTVDGVLKMLDFGMARVLLEPAEGTATRAGTMIGTPAFMAPEQALGQSARVDGRTDLWAVAAAMFAMITGQYVHEAETMQEMLIRAGSMRARSVLAVAPNLPPRVAEVIDKALAFLPTDRWPDAQAMQAVLEDAYLFSYGAPLPRGLESSRPPSSSAAAPTPAVDPRALTEHVAFPLVPSLQKATTTKGLAQDEIRIPWGTLVLGACALAGGVLGALAFEGKGPLGGPPPPAPLSPGPPSALPEARPVNPAVSIAPPPSAVPNPPGASAAPAVDAGASIEAPPFVDGGAPSAGPSPSAVNAARPAIVPTPTTDVRPSSTPPSPAMPPETNPTIPGCNPTFVIDTEGHKIFKPECFPGKAPPL